ncbi:MAG: sulfatase-like hydrolase/transferase [Planctomycetales bacterium]|nr:sulfatase-like hydrolase/transferase [Planctomycetales bacterium]MCA9182632.1 sulfatase-like hydrolase/transferase [Planctomycetales bacterium]
MTEAIDCCVARTTVLQSYRSQVDLFKRLVRTQHGFRRVRWLLIAAVIAALGGSVNWLQAQTSETAHPTSDLPDVIFILADDQAWNDYSFMGHPHIRTPELDRLAQESQLFTRGYVPDSLCRPSLATIITGLYPHQHGIVGNDPPPGAPNADGRMRAYKSAAYQKDIEQFLKLHIDQVTTLPDRLKSLGYTSFQTGKWWEGNPSRGGFDSGMTHGDPNRGGRHGDVGLDIGRKGMQPIEQFVDRSRRAKQPYFLWYAPFLPHAPHNPPEELLAHYRDLAPTESIAKYWAMCEWFDQTVGQLRTIVDERGRPDNTLIVYVCDNGWINLPDKSSYAPKSKRSQYDGGTRTPIMLHWPGHITASRDDVHLASSIDLVPSVMALLGMAPDDALPGIVLTDPAQVTGRDTLFGEIFEHDIQSMDDPLSSLRYRWIIEGYTKLILPDLKQVPDGVPELYDLEHDPWEEHNLAGERTADVQRLSDKLNAWWP